MSSRVGGRTRLGTRFFSGTARASDQRIPRECSKSARLATQRGRHAAAIVPDLQLTRDAARRVCASFAPAHRILIPLRPLTGHSQLVSLSRPSRISVYPALFRPTFSLVPCPLVLAPPSTFSFGDINPSPSPPPRALCSLTLLFPPPHSHGNFFLFYAALYRCSCLLTHSLLQFFRRSLRSSRGVSPSSLLFLSFVRGKRSCSHPSYGFLSILPIQLYIHPSPAPGLVVPFICLPSPHHDRAHHLHHISNLAHILSAAVSQTLKSFLGN